MTTITMMTKLMLMAAAMMDNLTFLSHYMDELQRMGSLRADILNDEQLIEAL